jgi:hypothetical protein
VLPSKKPSLRPPSHLIAARSILSFCLRRRVRALGSVVLVTGLLVLWLSASAARAPAADTDLTQSALQARAAVGLPTIAENPAVLAAAGSVLDGADAQRTFLTNGGIGDLVTATAPAGGALSSDKLKVAVFDPRISAIAVLGRGTTVAVAAALDPTRAFPKPVLAGAVVDPAVVGSLAVLFPPASGTIPQILLQRKRGSQLVTIGIAATAAPAAEGAILVELKGVDRITGPQIGYGLTYTLKIGTSFAYNVRTRPFPTALLSRSFVAGPGFTGSDRRRFLATVAALPPTSRKIVDTIRGAITASVINNSAPICGAQTSCAGFDPGNGYFLVLNRAQLRSGIGRFVIDHEIGHLVDFLGLDSFSNDALRQLFSKSSYWKNCFPLRGQCVPFCELFADQFAFFSTNAHGVQSGYGDNRLATSSGFRNTISVQWAFRPPQSLNPLAGFGPLAKSFENALHSGDNEL